MALTQPQLFKVSELLRPATTGFLFRLVAHQKPRLVVRDQTGFFA